jgi:hypothetical protein
VAFVWSFFAKGASCANCHYKIKPKEDDHGNIPVSSRDTHPGR